MTVIRTLAPLAAPAVLGCAMAAATVLACRSASAAETPAAAGTPAAPSATPLKHPSLKVCNKQADARSLTGAARAQFVKACREGKPPGDGSSRNPS